MFNELTLTINGVMANGTAAQAYLFLAIAGTAALIGLFVSVAVPYIKGTK